MVRELEKRKLVIGKEREPGKRTRVVGKEQEPENKKRALGKEKEPAKRNKSYGESSKKSVGIHKGGQETSLHYTREKSKEVELKNKINELTLSARELEKNLLVIAKEKESEKRKRVVGKEKEPEKKKRVVGKERESARRNKEVERSSERLLSLCEICMDKKTKAEMFKSKCCSHSYCHDCISSHVAAKISQNIIKVKCPDLVCNSFLVPQNCRSFIPQQVLDRWEAALCESALGSKKIYCPFKDCSAPLVDDGEKVVTSAECPHCHRLFCAQCLVPWHAGSKCKSMDSDSMDKRFMDLAKRKKWQKCPHCSFYVQRIDGCESIRCRCGHNFCYVCGKGWVYGHLCPAAQNRVSF